MTQVLVEGCAPDFKGTVARNGWLAPERVADMARRLCALRHRHILTGYDHLLFIAALALAVTSFWELFKIIAAFTLAHTITLTLSVLRYR